MGPGVQRSFDDLGTPLREVTFCVVDLETTGGDRNGDLITEIGAVKVRGGEHLGTFHTLVNPGRAIPPKISILTGLTDALVATAPRVEAVLGSFVDFVGDAVVVGHNVGFDLGFLRAALERDRREPLRPVVVDTVALARRLVRDEVPDCKLGTLADRLRLDHRPTHRALDDALATTDLLHLLIERAAGLGVTGLDDLVALGKLAAHPQSSKLRMTTTLPRAPGVYLFCGSRDEVLYVGKATNLRQRVRSYFGSDDRRKIGPMLRETQRIRHVELADPLTAEVLEQRMIARLRPRYNRAGTRVDRYCSIRLDVDAPWPRLSVVREPSSEGLHLGPLPSRRNARVVVEAIESVVPLRRCSTRIGPRHTPSADAVPCAAAQLGVAACPCAGAADRSAYDEAVRAVVDTLQHRSDAVTTLLRGSMTRLAGQQRFEEAAEVRDRLRGLEAALRRDRLVGALRAGGTLRVRHHDGVVWTIDRARLVDVAVEGIAGRHLPVEAPDAPIDGRPLSRHQIDEALCLARHLDRHAGRIEVLECDGDWAFPIASDVGPTDPAPSPGRSDQRSVGGRPGDAPEAPTSSVVATGTNPR